MKSIRSPRNYVRWPALWVVMALWLGASYSHSASQVTGIAASGETRGGAMLAAMTQGPTTPVNTGPFRMLTDPPAGEYVFLISVSEGQKVKLVVQDESRRQIVTEELQVPANVRQVAVSNVNAAPGRYFVQLSTFTGTYVKNIVVE